MKYPVPPGYITLLKGIPLGRFASEVKKRWEQLTYLKVVQPLQFYSIGGVKEIYVEGIYAYLCELPNASVPMMTRCLEIALKEKYKETETTKLPDTLKKLIDWGEKYYGGEEKEYVHSFRYLRNLIHTTKKISEQTALKCIDEVTRVINILYPIVNAFVEVDCSICRVPHRYDFKAEDLYFGASYSLSCPRTKRGYPYTIIPD